MAATIALFPAFRQNLPRYGHDISRVYRISSQRTATWPRYIKSLVYSITTYLNMTATRMFNVFNRNILQHGRDIPSAYYILSQRTSRWPRHTACFLHSNPAYLIMAAPYRVFTILSQRTSTWPRHTECLLYSITTYLNMAATYRTFTIFYRNVPQHDHDIPSVYYILSQRTWTWPRHIERLLYSIATYLNMTTTYRVFTIFYHNVPEHGRDISNVYYILSQRTSTWSRHTECLLYSITTYLNMAATYRTLIYSIATYLNLTTTYRVFTISYHNVPEHGRDISNVYYILSQRTSTWPRHTECLLYSITTYLNMTTTYRVFTIFYHNVPQHDHDIPSVYYILSQRTSTWPRHTECLLYSITTYLNMAATYRAFTIFYYNVPEHGRDISNVYYILSQRTSTWPRHTECLLYSITTYLNMAATYRTFTIFYRNVPQHDHDIPSVYYILSQRTSTWPRHTECLLYSITTYLNMTTTYRVFTIFYHNVPQHDHDIPSVYYILSQRTSTWPWHIKCLFYFTTTYLNIAATYRGFRYSTTTYLNMAATYRGFTIFYHNVPQHGQVYVGTQWYCDRSLSSRQLNC